MISNGWSINESFFFFRFLELWSHLKLSFLFFFFLKSKLKIWQTLGFSSQSNYMREHQLICSISIFFINLLRISSCCKLTFKLILWTSIILCLIQKKILLVAQHSALSSLLRLKAYYFSNRPDCLWKIKKILSLPLKILFFLEIWLLDN